MRVALFTYGTRPRGGVVHTLALGEALQQLGHAACVFALDERGRGFYRKPRCQHVLVPVRPTERHIVKAVVQRIETYVAALQAMTLPYDVFHAQDGISGNALATLAERGTIPGFARTIHHVDAFDEPELAALQDRSIRDASQAFVVSRHWQAFVRERYGIEAAVVPNGVDLERFSPASAAQRNAVRERLAGAGPLFVCIGGVEPRKNATRALEALALVRATQPEARLIFAGGASMFDHAPYRAAFDARAAELGLRDGEEIAVTGVLSDEAIVELLHAADALVFPSLVEGFGLVLLEALACGTPVVASALPPFTEFLSRENALLVDPADATAIANGMLRALQPNVARRLAGSGPRVAARFSWKASARAHVERYREPNPSHELTLRA